MSIPRATRSDKPGYGDHSSTYWSPGWNYERYSNADKEELATIPEEEIAKIQNGMIEVLGEDGMDRWAEYQFEIWQKKQKVSEQSPGDVFIMEGLPPDFVKIWQTCYKGQKWGFVAYRTACYDDEQLFLQFKDRWDQMLEVSFQRFVDKPGVEEARAKFEI